MAEGILTFTYNMNDTIDNTVVTFLTNDPEQNVTSIESHGDFWDAYDSILERYKQQGSRVVTAPIIDRDERNHLRMKTTLGNA